jgi:hypothetical protein
MGTFPRWAGCCPWPPAVIPARPAFQPVRDLALWVFSCAIGIRRRTRAPHRIRHGRQNHAQCGAAPFHFEFPSASNRPRLTADGAPCRRFSHGWGWDPEDVGNLGQEGRTRWRKQAHAWLELDLAAWAGKLNDGISEDRRLLRSTLMRWLADPDLAALCEPGALKMLPVEERDEWLALWKGVDALIKRAIGA